MRKLWSVEITNFKGARFVFFPVKEGVTQIVGPNGAGKSSVLDAVIGTLAGARHIDAQPLTAGELRGSVKLDLGDIEVERRMTEANAERGGTLTVRAKDGAKWGQKELDVLFGDFSFDPQAFGKLKPADQIVVLQRLAGEDFSAELARLDEDIALRIGARADRGRDIKRMGAVQSADPPPPAPTVEAVLRALEIADAHNEEQRRRAEAKDRAGVALEAAEGKLARHQARVAELQQALLETQGIIVRSSIEVDAARDARGNLPLPEPRVDSAPLRAQIAEAGAAARRREEAAKAHARWTDYRALVDDHNRLEREIGELRDKRVQHIRSAKLPIQGLEWTDDGVTLNGIPLAQVSSSERLRACTRLGMALHPDLRLMLMREGSLLDEVSFGEVATLAEAEGYEVLMEVVGQAHDGPGEVIEIREGRNWSPFNPNEQF